MEVSQPPSVCFVAQQAYNVLGDRAEVRHIGGAETQQVALARGLSSRGYRVSFVVHDHGQAEGPSRDGVELYKSYRPEAGWPMVRFFVPRLNGLWSAMRRADADVYYQRGAESETGLVAWWCRRHGRRFVFALAGHHMLNVTGPARPAWRERALFRYGMTRADLILVQSGEQQEMMRRQFKLDSTVLPSVAPGWSDGIEEPDGVAVRAGVLWIGRFDRVKRLDACLDLAERLPDVMFTIVGDSNVESDYARRQTERIAGLRNVVRRGYVSPRDIRSCYRGSRVLLCTSASEGFPNTFLEAWASGTPVVSTVDPDQTVAKHGLGVVGCDVSGLGDGIELLLRDDEMWSACSSRCQEYVKRHHHAGHIAAQLDEHLRKLVPQGRSMVGPDSVRRSYVQQHPS